MASIRSEGSLERLHAGAVAEWPLEVSSDGTSAKISFSVVAGPDADAPDWDVTLCDASGAELCGNYHSNQVETEVDIPGDRPKMLTLRATCPKGARYGDTAEITVTADDGMTNSVSFKAVATQSIMILKTQVKQEAAVADAVYARWVEDQKNGKGSDVYAILSPIGLGGYVFVEGMNVDRLRDSFREVKKARRIIDGETNIDEISQYLTPVSAVVGISEGDIVELVNGPFKGEMARVQKIDEAKEEITVELIEAMVPIPVTVKGDSVRVVEKER